MKLIATRAISNAITPPAEYHSTSLLRFIWLPRALIANAHYGGEESESHRRREVDDVSQIEHAALESFEMRHYRESRDDLNDDGVCKAGQEVGDGRVAREYQEETDQYRENETDHLVPRHGGCHAAH